MQNAWTEGEIADLARPWEEFRERHPERTYKAWWNKRHALSPSAEAPAPEFADRVLPLDDAALDEYVERALRAAEAGLQNFGEQAEVTIQIPTDRPIGVAFTGDWHIGQRGTDHRALFADNGRLAETPGLYLVGMGDYWHNAKARTRPGEALYASLFPNPDDQRRIAERELRRFRGKLLALCRGCHESFDLSQAGVNPLVELAQALETVAFWHGGVIHLDVGKTRYEILARHRYGSSALNSTNAQRRAYDEYPEDERLDVVALGHLHFNDLQMRTRGRSRKTVYLRSGSYYVWDDYGQRLGGYRGERGVPVVILFPEERRIVPFEGANLEQAIEVLRYYRADY